MVKKTSFTDERYNSLSNENFVLEIGDLFGETIQQMVLLVFMSHKRQVPSFC
jgi:hypothetical protein